MFARVQDREARKRPLLRAHWGMAEKVRELRIYKAYYVLTAFLASDSWHLHWLPPRDVRKFKETKKQFDKVREDMELSLVRNAQAPRHRPHEVEEATGALTLTRKCFRHLALDYVLQVSCGTVEMCLLQWVG